ncbi:MAG: N-acetylmuramoyl-L-alanine amidase [Chloroflexi bacterium]|nr:N-acetylmuramoyl-L-alanine amidase [Chloroflexota bacterium]
MRRRLVASAVVFLVAVTWVPAQADGPLPAGVVLAPSAGTPGRVPVVALDPGHGGPDGGATENGLVERDLNLAIALDLQQQLRDAGIAVVMTRTTASAADPNYVSASRTESRNDLQARVDIANTANADLFISIHNNSSTIAADRGTEIWYDAGRPFADKNLAFAQLALDSIVQDVTAAGYPDASRGVRDDTEYRVFRGHAFQLYVLGPGTNGGFGRGGHAPANMPGVLGESLYLSNPGDAAALRQPAILHAIASGYAGAVQAYFQQFPPAPG